MHDETAQVSTKDKNADLCAASNYHGTLAAHGVPTDLVLVRSVAKHVRSLSLFCR